MTSSRPDLRPIRVVAAVLQRRDLFLVAVRPQGKHHGGLWEFPGGKVDRGETDCAALDRELREELGVGLAWCGPTLHVDRDSTTDIEIHFLAARLAGEPHPLEHDAIAWYSVHELGGLPLAPADARFVARLAAGLVRLSV